MEWPSPKGTRVSACGPLGEHPAVYSDREPGQVERIARAALAEPNHNAAARLLASYLPNEAGGIRNAGLFASYHLAERMPRRAEWGAACSDGASLLGLRREALLEALGFTLEPKGQAAVLRAEGTTRAVAVFLDDSESPDVTGARFGGKTPVSWAMAEASRDNIPYVVLTRGSQIRLYLTRDGAGATGRGGTSAFIEANLPLLTEQDAGYLPLHFSAAALADGGSFERLLAESLDFAANLGTRLRERIYGDTVPWIADALIEDHESAGGDTDEDTLQALYDRTLLVLFRLLFVAYAEDRELLPLSTNGLYRENSLKHRARQLTDLANEYGWYDIPFDEHATDYWDNVRALWTAVDEGRTEWGIPPYNGGMFTTDPNRSPNGAALASLSLTNAQFGPALLGLLVDVTGDEGQPFGPVDFASLDVREFGTIYEGLLESNLAVAQSDLTLDKDDVYVPAGPKDEVAYYEGSVYLHDKSGARKSSGSYFTKPFAVAHLLDHALDAALDRHVAELAALVESGKEADAAERFFDFRVVDLSMGSGHFLVAAVDRIESRLAALMQTHRVPGVLAELDRLSEAARQTLAKAGVADEGTDTNALLRRQIARRCIYGVDLNSTSVELARLALWIHTFVRGLPLTSLNHGLVQGNALTGIGTLDEALDVLEPDRKAGMSSFVRTAIDDSLAAASHALARFAATGEATKAEVEQAQAAYDEAKTAVSDAQLLLDFAVAVRIGEASVPLSAFDVDTLLAAARASGADDVARDLEALHFPITFPEVFSRPRPGFDCILGNPPWEKVHVEEHAFWGLRFPGLRGLPVAKMNAQIRQLRAERPDLIDEYEAELAHADQVRAVLLNGPYPDIGASHPDLYKAFAWRFWHLVREHGTVGVVLPRAAMASSGMKTWRERVLGTGEFLEVTVGTNTGGWMFDDAEYRYTICLVSAARNVPPGRVLRMHGPYASLDAYRRGMLTDAVVLPVEGLRAWTTGAALPLIPGPSAAKTFLRLQESPRLDEHPEFRFRAIQGDLNATSHKGEMILDPRSSHGLWPIYKGASFNLWDPATGEPYAWAKPSSITRFLQERRAKSAGKANGAYAEMGLDWARDASTLPCLHPRIVFRDVARATDSRTLICCLIPGEVLVNHTAPYLLRIQGDETDEAFLLGVMSSRVFDWVVRRIVEAHVTFDLLNAFPVPSCGSSDRRRQRAVEIAGSLAAVDDRYKAWAKQVGVPVGSVKEAERDGLLAELDANVASLYGLDRADLETILETFHDKWDYRPNLKAVLGHFDQIVEAS